MHIHGQGMNHNNMGGIYGAAGAERDAEARRAAEVRKRLLRIGQAEESGEDDSFSSLLLADKQPGVTGVEQYPYSPSGRDPDLG